MRTGRIWTQADVIFCCASAGIWINHKLSLPKATETESGPRDGITHLTDDEGETSLRNVKTKDGSNRCCSARKTVTAGEAPPSLDEAGQFFAETVTQKRVGCRLAFPEPTRHGQCRKWLAFSGKKSVSRLSGVKKTLSRHYPLSHNSLPYQKPTSISL